MDGPGTATINTLGHLEIGGCDTVDLAERFGTPLYVLDEALIRANCRHYHQAIRRHTGHYRLYYASKAFLTLAMCRLMAQEGFGLDVVSGGELATAMAAGFDPALICMHGNHKTDFELRLALEYGVGRLVIDNRDELIRLSQLAQATGHHMRVLLRIIPGVQAPTHGAIATGHHDSKFGIPLDAGLAVLKEAQSLPNVQVVGLHSHVGSQIFSVQPFQEAAQALLGLYHAAFSAGFQLKELNLGGGLAIRHHTGETRPDLDGYIRALLNQLFTGARQLGLAPPLICLEPGRSIVGEAGWTLYRTGISKPLSDHTLVSVDGGMTDNPRPALYQAAYDAVLANDMRREGHVVTTVAGRCCESGDLLIQRNPFPPTQVGDLLAIPATGAYTYAMASHYNRLPKPAVVLVHSGRADVIVERETYADLYAKDRIPEHLKP